MNKEMIEIEAESRKNGRHWCRVMRKKGMVPAVVYGPKFKNLEICLDERYVKKYSSDDFINRSLNIKVDGKPIVAGGVFLKSVSVDPVTRRPLHVDFYAPSSSNRIVVKVMLNFVGKAKGVAEGGLLQPRARFVEIQCFPQDIPEMVDVDVTELGVGATFRTRDLSLDKKLRVMTPPDEPLAAVIA